MSELIVKEELCKGCGYCVDVCPKKCISMSDVLGKSGYKFVKVDKAECIQCGSCYTVCPDNVYQII